MKGKSGLLMAMVISCPISICASGLIDIATALDSVGCYEADARFSVTLPQNETDIVYNIHLTSASSPADSLSPCRYLTEWHYETPSGGSDGFSAYFDGHHYRYRNERLQEYHTEWDSVPFMRRGNVGGVQSTAQFTELYPQYMASELRRMASDSRYNVEVNDNRVFDGRKAVYVSAVMTVAGVTAMEKEFYFDAATMLPLRVDLESNPGQLTEQSLLVDFTYPDSMDCPDLTEEALVKQFPEVFEKYRESNFRIENLSGTQLPSFSLPTTTGERYTYHRGDRMAAPTVIVMLDPQAGFCKEIVDEVRTAADRLPRQADVIWVFNSNNIDAIEAVVPSIRPGEHLLMNGRSLARDTGASSLPVLIMVGSDGRVKDVALGFNRELGNVVLQTMALVR